MQEKRRAFSLVELMIVVLILGALAAVAIPRITGGAHTARVTACQTNVDVLNSQIELYKANEGEWPNFLTDLDDPNYLPDELPTCPFGTTYDYNTTIYRITEHNH